MREEYPDKTQNKNRNIAGTGRFLKESSTMDTSEKFSDISLQELASGINKNLTTELLKMEETQKKQKKQKEFLLNLMPEIFHDVRSPFISIIGFAGIFKQKTHSDKEISEYSEEILEESHSALKRLEALEAFFRLFMEANEEKLEKFDILETIEWIFTLLQVKISRKKLKILKRIDKNLKNRDFLTYAGNVRLLLFELLCRLIVEAGNKTTLTFKAVGKDDHIVVSMLTESGENSVAPTAPAVFHPAFEVDTVITKVIPGQGFLSVIRQETPK